MNTNTTYEQSVIEALRPLDTAYNQHFTPEQAHLYHQVLTGLCVDVQKLRLAVTILITSVKFLPSIAEILETIRSLDLDYTITSDPYDAWSHVLQAASSIGFDNGLSVLTPLEARAAKTVGWRDICYGPSSDTSLRRAHFFKVFQSFIDREHFAERQEALLLASKNISKSLNTKLEAITYNKTLK